MSEQAMILSAKTWNDCANQERGIKPGKMIAAYAATIEQQAARITELESEITRARSQPYRPPATSRSQPMEQAFETKCGKCGQPIHPSESGVRHFGTFTAHAENRCISILNARAEAAEAEVKRLLAVVNVARCIRHWHDTLYNKATDRSEGMVVSAEAVRDLWVELDKYDKGLATQEMRHE